MNDLKLRLDVSDFVLGSALALDRNDFDAWLGMFDEDTRYVVMPRDNEEQGYPIGVMHCGSKNVLKDRIAVLLHASKFNPHYDRHIVGGTCIKSRDGDVLSTTTNFMVVQTTLTGSSQLFCCGAYEDRIRVGEPLRLVERIVMLDTFSVPNCLATPL